MKARRRPIHKDFQVQSEESFLHWDDDFWMLKEIKWNKISPKIVLWKHFKGILQRENWSQLEVILVKFLCGGAEVEVRRTGGQERGQRTTEVMVENVKPSVSQATGGARRPVLSQSNKARFILDELDWSQTLSNHLLLNLVASFIASLFKAWIIRNENCGLVYFLAIIDHHPSYHYHYEEIMS